MLIEIKVPLLPESVADAVVLAWHKAVGDAVERDEILVELETDKVVLEIPAPQAGILDSIIAEVGIVVTAESILAKLDPSVTASLVPSDKTANTASENLPVIDDMSTKSAISETIDPSPAVRRLAAEHALDLTQIQGSGKGGRIVKEDLLKVVEATDTAAGTYSEQAIPSAVLSVREEKRVPMSRLRAKIAERLVQAQHNAAMLTTFNEVNLNSVMVLRARYKEAFEKKHGVKLGLMSFFTKAVVEALKQFPAVNASIDGSDIIYHAYQDIGIAVATDRGLVVPVLRDVARLSMAEIEQSIQSYTKRARDNKLSLDEMQGGTFTITNGGVFGSLLATPILNPPQVAILGMHQIAERPVVEKGEIVIRPMMYLALSYDHRIIDGKESVQFLVTVKSFLEDPQRFLLDV